MIQTTLTWAEAEAAAFAGIKRQLLALHDSRPDYYGFNGEPWGTHIEAAGAELAVAKHLGLWWTPWARRPANVVADVGTNIQVRRRSKAGWNLLLHPNDSDHHLFVLVSGSIPTFTLHGCISGADGKSEEFWGDPYNTGRPAFWVPHDRLTALERPQDTLWTDHGQNSGRPQDTARTNGGTSRGTAHVDGSDGSEGTTKPLPFQSNV